MTKQSDWKPCWIPKVVEEGEEFSEDELRRRIGSHLQEAKIELERDKEERLKSAREGEGL
jgi:hypothetical protein